MSYLLDGSNDPLTGVTSDHERKAYVYMITQNRVKNQLYRTRKIVLWLLVTTP